MPVGEMIQHSESDMADPFRPVHGVGPLTPHELDRVERAIQAGERVSDARFSVLVGAIGEGQEPRRYATRVHARLERPEDTVLVVVDPAARVLEIVTGPVIRRSLTDTECRLAAASMESSFAADDLAGGLTAGIQQLATSAYHAPVLHAAEPY